MTNFGKAMTIANLFLAFTFLGLAVYIHRFRVDLAAELRNARSEVSTLEQKKSAIQDVVTKLEETKQAETNRLVEAENANKQRSAALNTKIEELSTELANVRGEVDKTGANLRQVVAQQQQRREQVEKLRETLGALDGENDGFKNERFILSNHLSQATINVAELKSRNDELLATIKNLEKLPSGR